MNYEDLTDDQKAAIHAEIRREAMEDMAAFHDRFEEKNRKNNLLTHPADLAEAQRVRSLVEGGP